jgi:hypothetical protein
LNKEERFKKVDVLEEVEEGGGGRERITTKDVKDYSIARDLKAHVDKFQDKIELDIEKIVEAKKIPPNLKKIIAPTRLYQSTNNEDDPYSTAKKRVLRKSTSVALFSNPKIYIRQGTSVVDKSGKDLPSPKNVNSKGKNILILPHFL